MSFPLCSNTKSISPPALISLGVIATYKLINIFYSVLVKTMNFNSQQHYSLVVSSPENILILFGVKCVLQARNCGSCGTDFCMVVSERIE